MTATPTPAPRDGEPAAAGPVGDHDDAHATAGTPATAGTVVAGLWITAAGLLTIAAGLVVVLWLTLVPLSQPAIGQPLCAISHQADQEIPADYLRLYRDTARRYGLDWAVLAAIGRIESGHGQNMGPSSAGALGPMQFMPTTWTAYATDGNHDGNRDVMDPADAIPAAARYLRAAGAPADWHAAIFAYNHADWYVRMVLDQADRYRAACPAAPDFDGGDGTLAWPLRGPITSPFGMRWGRLHAGIDIAVPAGTPIHAAADGTVTLASPVTGYGNYLCITHQPRLTTCYAHLSSYRTHHNAHVRRGQVVGLVGCTGRCFGDHLHFEVRLGPPWATPIDPLKWLAG